MVTRSERLDRTLSRLARRGTLGRLHKMLLDSADVDLDRASYLVLRRVGLDGPARITDLAELLGVEPSTISRHVQSLESSGLLSRRSDPKDRRVCVVEATALGSRLVARVEEERRSVFDHALAGWSDGEIDAFVNAFERFGDDLADVIADLSTNRTRA